MNATMPALLAMTGRGSLPYAPLHRSPLYVHALQALAASGVQDIVVAVESSDADRVRREVLRAKVRAKVSAGTDWWQHLREQGTASAGLLVHDALCPLASADFLRSVRQHGTAGPAVSRLAYRPVTDTVKTVVGERIQGTIDRESLAALVSPAVVAPEVLAAAMDADDRPPVDDFALLAAWLRQRGEVEMVRAPSLARRVDDASAVNLLECVDELARQVRREPASTPAGLSDEAGRGTR